MKNNPRLAILNQMQIIAEQVEIQTNWPMLKDILIKTSELNYFFMQQ